MDIVNGMGKPATTTTITVLTAAYALSARCVAKIGLMAILIGTTVPTAFSADK